MDAHNSAKAMDKGADAALKTYDNSEAVHESAPGGNAPGTGTPAFNKDGAIGGLFKGDGPIGKVGNMVGGPLSDKGVVGYVPFTYSFSNRGRGRDSAPPRVAKAIRQKRRGSQQKTREAHENQMMVGMPSGVPMNGHTGYATPIRGGNMYSQMEPAPSGMAMSSPVHTSAIGMGGGIGMPPSDVSHSFYCQTGEHRIPGISMEMAPSGADAGTLMPLTWNPDMSSDPPTWYDPNMPWDNNTPTTNRDMLHLDNTLGNMATEMQIKQEPARYQTLSPMSSFPDFIPPNSKSTWMGTTPTDQLESQGNLVMQRTQSMPQPHTNPMEFTQPLERNRSTSAMAQPISCDATIGQQRQGHWQAPNLPSQRLTYSIPAQQRSQQPFQPSPCPNHFRQPRHQMELSYIPQNANHYQHIQSAGTSSRNNFNFQSQNNTQSFLGSQQGNNLRQDYFDPQFMPPSLNVHQPMVQSTTSLSNRPRQNHNHPHAPEAAQCPPRERVFIPQALTLDQHQAVNAHHNNHNTNPRSRSYPLTRNVSSGQQVPSSLKSSVRDEAAGPMFIKEPCQSIKDKYPHWEVTSPPSTEPMTHRSVLLSAQHCGEHAPVQGPEMEPVEVYPATVDASLPNIDDIRARRDRYHKAAVTGQTELQQALAEFSSRSYEGEAWDDSGQVREDKGEENRAD